MAEVERVAGTIHPSAAKGLVLILEDSAEVSRAIQHMLPRSASAVCAFTLGEARALLGSVRDYDCAIVDIALPDGDGLTWIREVRRRGMHIPIMILSGHSDPRFVNAAHDLDARVVIKPPDRGRISDFVTNAQLSRDAVTQAVRQAIEETATRTALTPKQRQLLECLGRASISRKDLPNLLGISVTRAKHLVGEVLAKTGHDGTNDLRIDILLRALRLRR